ncbi:MAG: DegT/DnrJ/EryC1/StrS family aminotransferase, partial [Planctomycetaceae bacterium]|nr:DegT/DnrJ/EryC1/StrS family aminotransferase [Planctomycetaceae bacterium]
MSQNILPLRRGPDPVPMIDLVEQHQSIRADVMQAVEQVFDTQRFVLGETVEQFEDQVASYCDSRFAIGCASGTDALILALKALGVGRGDEVITTPYSFFATASAITRAGARPVFADIDPITFNLCPQAAAAAITPRTKAILPVHLYGQCADMEPLWRLAVRHGVAIVEDAAQAIGATYRGRRTGVLGNVGCFSFFPTKNLGGAGDGGMMTTDDKDIATRLRRLRVHGDLGGYQHVEVGMNSRLDALQAAVLSVKLRHLDQWSTVRQENAARYAALMGQSGLTARVELPAVDTDCGHVFNQFCVRVPNGQRDLVLAGLRERQVGCAVYYPRPLHLQECFSHLGGKEGQFPEAERAAAETLALPIYPELGAARQERVV